MEEWRSVVGYEGWYEVSDRGRARRVKAGPGTRPGRILKPLPWGARSKTYLGITLRRDGQKQNALLHRLVYEAFCGEIPDGHVIHHRNRDTQDNRTENLQALSPSEHTGGEANGSAKMTERDVIAIRRRYTGRWGDIARLAEHHSVSPRAIRDLLRGETRRHVNKQ